MKFSNSGIALAVLVLLLSGCEERILYSAMIIVGGWLLLQLLEDSKNDVT